MEYIFNKEEVKAQVDMEYRKFVDSIGKTNILILGQTGVGKSSLLNQIFGEKLAKVSNVKPETRGFHTFSSDKFPINIIDSEGYELENSAEFKINLKEYVDDKFIKISEQVHLAWYCINVSSSRVLPFDIENIEFLVDALKIPTAVVFTQCDLDDENGSTASSLNDVIRSQCNNRINTFQVSNLSNLKLDIEKLIEWSSNNISDENVKAAFILSQKVDLKVKYRQAQKYIIGAAATAAGIGATPIPVADSAALLALQTGLALKIFSIYGIREEVGGIALNILKARIISTIGKTLAGSLFKLIPGAGTIVGGLINATVASSLTYSLGYALSKLAEKLFMQTIEGPFDMEIIKNIITVENLEKFMKQFTSKKDNA